MCTFLQIDTVLHNFIDNRNHYLYHSITDEATPRLCRSSDHKGRPATSTEKQRAYRRQSGAPARVSSTFCLFGCTPHGDMECSG
jgi:hypothetical protein